MRRKRGIRVAGLGAVALGCLGALAHCGGGSSGSPGPGNDSGPGEQDATITDAQGGPEAEPSGDSSPREPDAGSDGSVNGKPDAEGGSIDAAPDGASPVDAGPDANSAEGGLDAGPDAIADAGPPGPPCDAQAACITDASTVVCCSGYCIDTARDPANCGQCGNACSATQFCTGTACDNAVLANVCANARGTVALDPYGVDNDAGIAVGTALVANCIPAPTIVQVSQFTPGVTDLGNGRPVTGPGNTFITGGGYYGQAGVAYMEKSITPLYLTTDGTTAQIKTRSGTAIVDVAVSTLTSQHDYFYVQLSVEPKSGTLCFSSAGMGGPGTLAAGYYVSQVMIPGLSGYTSSWYVYVWQDANSDFLPSANEIALVMAGP
jgi:hypothetical protein